MEKSQYETYEFFPVNTEGSEQFFVVQDDGTYLINRQVQYVTQVENVKPVLDGQSCTVYDVSEVPEQPFFVDVDNSSELMSVTDQFVLPDAPNNLYSNSYLLQPSTTADQVQVKEDVSDVQLNPTNSTLGVDLGTSGKPVNSYTEITLTDEQYHKLEQRGYILLELSDKVYVLDSSGGLRDITSNHKLIQKLKIDDENWNKNTDVKVENNLNTLGINQNLPAQPQTLEFVITNDIAPNADHIEPLIANNTSKDNAPKTPDYVNQEIKIAPLVNSAENNVAAAICSTPRKVRPCDDVKVFIVESEKEEEHSKNIIKIKTKLSLKDIPDKIILGKTTKGKTLVARVKKTAQTSKTTLNDVDITLRKSIRSTVFDPEDMNFPDLIKVAIQNPEQSITCKDMQALDMIISQLIQVPSFHPSIDGDNYLFITKIIKTESEKEVTKSKPIIWTGRAKLIDHEWGFEHLPNILQSLIISDEYKTGASTVIHIQILEEVRRDTNVVKTSVSVNKKQLLPGRPKKKDTVYACSACAAVFNSEHLLKRHQEEYLHNVDTSDLLTMDVDPPLDTEYTSSGDKYYACMQCNAKFTRLNHCKNHMKTHGYTTTNEDGSCSNSVLYKCNMCPNTYFHPSTLTKHIVSKHIKISDI